VFECALPKPSIKDAYVDFDFIGSDAGNGSDLDCCGCLDFGYASNGTRVADDMRIELRR